MVRRDHREPARERPPALGGHSPVSTVERLPYPAFTS